MTDRERFLSCVLAKPVDRPPFWLFWGPWGRTRQRWEQEGMPADITDHRSFANPDVSPQTVPVLCGPCPRFEREILAEDEDYVTFTDTWGILRRDYKHGESMSEFIKFPVANRDDWERYKAERLDPHHPDRLAGDWRERCRQWRASEYPIQLGYYPDVTFYGGLRWLVGDEDCLYLFYDDPELVHEIMGHLADLYLTVFAAVVQEVRVDVIHIWEDMCGRQGPLISPAHWREFMAPCYRRIWRFAQEHDIEVLSVDTDGNPDDIVPPMMEARRQLPVADGGGGRCDVNFYRERYPDLALMGGIDKRALAQGPEAIDAELDRIWPAVLNGRYVPDLDHGIPDDVSWENYRYYAEQLRDRVMSTVGAL